MADVDVMAFGAHPDDIEIGCGGTLIKLSDMGYSMVLVDMSRGELSTRGTQLAHGFWRHPEWGQQPCRVELGQDQGSLSVRLAPSRGDEGHERWMNHGD